MTDQRTVVFRGDGESPTTADHIRRLAAIDANATIAPDDYSRGGVVERLERAMAEELGKEAAIFVATGTLANLLAIRRHCFGRGQRVLVQEQGHVYADTGDGATLLAGLNLVPLAPGRPAFTRDEVAAALDRAAGGRVATPVGALVIESPVRRQGGRVVPFDEMRAITALCQERDVRTHLDGARLYMMAAATGIPVRDYAALFDSIYVSLWKYLGAPFGAILAGSAELIDGLYHERRMFGGGLPSSALAAALALDGLPGFAERFAEAMDKARSLLDNLDGLSGLTIERFPNGSNIFPLHMDADVDPAALVAGLADQGIVVPAAAGATVQLTVNTTVLRRSNEEIVSCFRQALSRPV